MTIRLLELGSRDHLVLRSSTSDKLEICSNFKPFERSVLLGPCSLSPSTLALADWTEMRDAWAIFDRSDV